MSLCLCVIALPRQATAGAFLLPEGEGQFIGGIGYVEASRRFDPSGAVVDASAYRKAEARGYLEYGVTSRFDLILAPALVQEHAAPGTNAVTGSQASAIGARFEMYSAPGRVVSAQVLIEPPIGASGGLATDMRLLLGQDFTICGWFAFANIEPGFVAHADPLPDEVRLDLTVGIRPTANVMILLQDFSSISHATGPVIARQTDNQIELSAVYDLSRRWSIQVGALRTMFGRNAIRETGPLAALWYRF